MKSYAPEKTPSPSERLYGLLLAAYPSDFRREYGREMSLVFADRRREGGRGAAALARVWCDTLLDLARSAPKEHLERRLEGIDVMRVLRTVALALLAYAFALLVVAPLYVRNKEAMPGFVNSLIDATISTGLIFNFIYLLLTLPRWVERARAVRVALVLTAVVVASLITLMMLSGGPHAYAGLSVVAAQVLSLLVWFTVHRWWVLRRAPGEAGPTATA